MFVLVGEKRGSSLQVERTSGFDAIIRNLFFIWIDAVQRSYSSHV